MIKKLINNTGSIVAITDVGQSVPASGQLIIDPSDYDKYAQSNNVVTFIANGTLTVNDGTVNYNIAQGTALIQGSPLALDFVDDLKSDNRLKTNSVVTGTVNAISYITNLRMNDMNVANGGVARNSSISAASYTNIYNYNGSGLILSFLITLEGNLIGADPFFVKLIIDSVTAFEINTLDLGTTSLYNSSVNGDANIVNVQMVSNTLKCNFNSTPLRYMSNVTIQLKKVSGGTKKFRAGMITLTKE